VVLMDVIRATGDVNVTANHVLPISFQTDRTTGIKKTIETSADGSETFDVGPWNPPAIGSLEGSASKTYTGDWVMVDDGNITVILDKSRNIFFGDRVFSSRIYGSTLKFGAETGTVSAGDTVSKAVNVVLSNVSKQEMLTVKNNITYLTMPDGWQGLLLKDTDGREYAIVNNFYGGDGTATFNYTGKFGTPVILQGSSIDNAGHCTLTLTGGTMSTYYTPLDQWVKVNGTGIIKVVNIDDENKFYIHNDGKATVSVDITFTKDGVPVGSRTGCLAANGASYEVSLVGGRTVVVTSVETIPKHP